ncbi:TetR family transcriptional regulator [Paenarthrobacter nitroguajacolicus]|uniref:TetR/AcrR family transcriptional regulator n=1 Tax=Paenarthrobacter nitroguajacolicus TaxID=211146 RepID=UPI0028663F54|nr:TetR family transcriptional regulator [Paenarthrobacter nitroguajacolicus]MDR6637037.1 AcrR family transcriptional regulator [Paenarthrobacter nitroguajacolicus]
MREVPYGDGRQALLASAIQIVADQGLRGLTYRSVAAAAGVTHGSVRYHFGDWANLVEAALEYSARQSISETLSQADDARDISEFAAALGAAVAENPAQQLFQYELALESRRRPELLSVIERVYATYRAAVASSLEKFGIDDPELTELAFVAIDGIVFHQAVFGSQERTQRLLNTLREVLATRQTDGPDGKNYPIDKSLHSVES